MQLFKFIYISIIEAIVYFHLAPIKTKLKFIKKQYRYSIQIYL